jgi:polar amino acid transport system permease protein
VGFELQFAPVFAEFPVLAHGFWLTIELSLSAMCLGGSLGLLVAMMRHLLSGRARWPLDVYVESIRNTPFLVQLYLIFFGLPSLGIWVSAESAGLIAMTVNLGAYTSEIFRGGIESVHRSQIEAALSLALTRQQVFRRVVLAPAVAHVWPSLVSQFTLILLTSSVCSFISVEELSGAAAYVQSNTFRSLEVYILVALAYLGAALALKAGLTLLGRQLFSHRLPRKRPATGIPANGKALP